MDLISPRPVSMLAAQLQRRGFKNRGIAHLWMEKKELNLLLQASETAGADDLAGLTRLMTVSALQWRKWFFTDLDGNPILIGVTPHNTPDAG
jgi:hypothetical protein